MTDTAVQGPGLVLVPGEGTAGLVPVPAKERNYAIFVKKEGNWETQLNIYYFHYSISI